MSMQLGLISFAISLVIGVVIGVLQARFKDGIIDGIGTIYTILVNAVPPLVAYSLVLVFGSHVLKLPSMYSTRNPGPSMILPVACLSLSSIAGYALWTRRYMVDELNKDYIKLARVKGLSSKRIMVTHVLRNAFVPLAQYIPYSILLTVGGSLLVERFFSVPGMGSLLTDAINRYDTNVVQTLVILYAALGIIGVFLGDVLMMIIDPRIIAAVAYKRCYALSNSAKADDFCAITDWRWRTYMRLGRKEDATALLKNLPDGYEKAADACGYTLNCAMYQGKISPEDLMKDRLVDGHLDAITSLYALSNYYYVMGDMDKSNELVDKCLEFADANQWCSFGYLAARVDQAARAK